MLQTFERSWRYGGEKLKVHIKWFQQHCILEHLESAKGVQGILIQFDGFCVTVLLR